MRGNYSSHWDQRWSTVCSTIIADGALFLFSPQMLDYFFATPDHKPWGIFYSCSPLRNGGCLLLLTTDAREFFSPICPPPPKVWRTVGEHGSGLNSWREVDHVIHLGNLCHHGVERWRRQKNGQVVSIVGLLFLGGGVWLSGLLS